jgi:voltage-gated sodium channel
LGLFLNERFILLLIALNAVAIVIEGFAPPEPLSSYLEIFDNSFTILFLLELAVKVRRFGLNSYLRDNWNKFDCALIVLAIPSLLSWVFQLDWIDLDFLLVFRILRVFKFFRFIRFIPRINHLIAGVQRAMQSSVLIVFVFIIFNFIISLVNCFLFRELSTDYFGDPLISFYSTFKVFTIEGWYEIPDTLTEDTTDWVTFLIRGYFVIILFCGGIFGLSLVNSIFVDSMISDNNSGLEESMDRIEKRLDQISDDLANRK